MENFFRGNYIAAAIAPAACIIGLAVTPLAAMAAMYSEAAGGTPERNMIAELTEFRLCELDLKTLALKGECIPAQAPGDVFTALMRSGRIPDPYQDDDSLKAQWVDDRAWRYETDFHYEPVPGKRVHLLFMGLDYISRIELNGKTMVQRHEGMFSRVDLDITDALESSGSQKLSVTLFGIPGANTEWLGPMLGSSEFGRRNYLKTQMSFGWDFAPRLKGAGIWDRVFLYETGPIAVRDVVMRTRLDGSLAAEVELSAPSEAEADLTLTINDIGGTQALALAGRIDKGEQSAAVSGQVSDPKLWWPWDMGEQNLYRVTAQVKVGDAVSDEVSETFGFREISWGPNPDAPPGSADWVLFVNGKREFMRGANWVPPEAMYGRMDDSRCGKIIGLAKDAGVNLLRVWGGGNRERRAFYDYCDRAGVMVWQEFPFACVYLIGYPKTAAFQDLTRQEVDEIVRQLRNHPSLIQWCGGNEFNVPQNIEVVNIMAEVTAKLDPTRRFIPASPYKGDTHNWVVWHNFGNLSDYFADVSPFPSEFGLQAMPPVADLQKWISPQYLWPINRVLEHHDLGTKKMNKYVSAIGHEDSLESYDEATQIMQAYLLQRGIENWRQRKYKTSGTAFWQLNEPWTAICWSVLDYDLTPKLSYEFLKNTYNPVLVTARFDDKKYGPGDAISAEIMVVNDLHQEFNNVEIGVSIVRDETSIMNFGPFELPGDTVISLGKMEYTFPAGREKPELFLALHQGSKVLARNHYLLWVSDPVPAGGARTGLERIGKRIMSGTWMPKAEGGPK